MTTTKNIELINKIGQQITSTLNLGEVIGVLHDSINTVMDATGFVIYVYNPSLKCLEVKYKLGKHKNIVANNIPIDAEDSFCLYSLKNKAEVFINDVRMEYSKYISSYYWSQVPDEEIIQSFINIPLIVREEAFGVISVQSFQKNSYTTEHLEVLKSLASYMSIALNNADTHSQLISAKESLHEQKKIIEEKNKDITASINYAKRIQQAKLPSKELIDDALPESFVLYKPKDIVSGDFYYLHKTAKSVFIAAADCTGHGVPGALMSMICSEQLKDAIAQSTDTSEILTRVNKGIKASLGQTESPGSTHDGMDIALCAVDSDARVVKYAGANRPIWIIRRGHTIVEEILGTKKAIGGFTADDQHFDTHEVKFQQGDTFYISTDGFADTFGGKAKKRVTTQRFKEILLSIQDKSLKEQEQHLDNFIEDWKGGSDQVDDILIIGVQL